MKKETWKTVFQIVLSILTAIAASLGVTSMRHRLMTHPLFLYLLLLLFYIYYCSPLVFLSATYIPIRMQAAPARK